MDEELTVVFTASLHGTLDEIANQLAQVVDHLREGYRSGDGWDTEDPRQTSP
jgi:hypothetical protein